MHNYTPTKSYRILLSERQGRGFNEFEVIEILQQVLTQLAQIHTQGLVHGGISIDTLVLDQNTLQAALANNIGAAPGYISPEQLQTGQVSTTGDIYALGVTILVLLTAQNPEVLRNYDGTWNWQEYCVCSDELATILEKAIALHPQYRIADAIQMLQALNSPIPSQLISPIYTYPVIPQQRLGEKFPQKLAPWKWGLISAGIVAVIGLAGVKLTSQTAKQNNSTTVANSEPKVTTTPTPANTAPTIRKNDLSGQNDENNRAEPEVSPEDFVRQYYSNINSGNYQAAWNMLPTDMQNNKSLHPDGYVSYIDWWNKVERIDIQRVYLESKSNYDTVVKVDANYVMKSRNNSFHRLRYLFAKDSINNKWILNKVKLADNTNNNSESVAGKSSVEFIREHYALLNQHQYKLAWNCLTPEFQRASGGPSQYINWWNSVSRIEVGQVSLVRETDTSTIVNAELSYVMKRGNIVKDTKPNIVLIKAGSWAGWKIIDKN
ncbi:hypothetical protein [Nostoc sp.]|uniref:hypothetical protein n=1 Tax=Nostoc sp. TaxID=1180 RepID=UPI002FF6B37B